MASALFTLRKATAADKPYLDSYCFAEGMDHLDDVDGVSVAVNDEDEPVGFIQIAFSADGVAHVYPIVVCGPWRGYGVGAALIESAYEVYGELRLVSRGSSTGFYERIGFEHCSWDIIDHDLTEGCIDCPMKEQCSPSPMRKR